MSTRVAAVVVAWNCADLLPRCLAAIECQTIPFARVLVVDNASEPPATAHVGELLRLQCNTGFAAGNNFAIARLNDCEWVALINPDAFIEPDWLEQMLAAAQRHRSAASLGSRLVQAGTPSLLDGAGDIYHFSGMVWRNGHGDPVGSDGDDNHEVFSVCAAAALYRKDAFVEVGGFDETFFCYVEDVDLGFRLRLAGYAAWHIPAARAVHVGSASSGGRRSRFSVYHGHRNLVWCYVKNMPACLLVLLLAPHLLANIASVFIYLWRGSGSTILRAKLDAVRGIPGVWRKRRAVQASRKVGSWNIWRFIDKRLLPGRLS